jgi:tRNA1(Val) A37 N6-methylase TrmN6
MNRALVQEGTIHRRKAMGVHYTPAPLARFIAGRLVSHMAIQACDPIKMLDPACGDGTLLEALLDELHSAGVGLCEAYGVEADRDAIEAARSRLSRFANTGLHLTTGDFLESVAGEAPQLELWASDTQAQLPSLSFDAIIANPPYVRTQVLGAQRAQKLAARFGLRGRVDLYYAFVVAATKALRPGGMLGIITSNRFLTTLAGASIRAYLSREYDVEEVIDLGDTKLFDAAVLPAVFLGRRRSPDHGCWKVRPARFTRLYECRSANETTVVNLSPDARVSNLLRCERSGRYRVGEAVFELKHGYFHVQPKATHVWSLTTSEETEWVRQVREKAAGVFRDVASVRVGVKTTADEVFIRKDWNQLPGRMQPEAALLRPLLTHQDARRWRLAADARPASWILYPHEVLGGRRQAVDLRLYPRANAYLEFHRQRLEKREYVLAAGRQWYEVWVPQDPGAWRLPKIVFPDISAEPRFYLDEEGRLVNGDCYWITLRPDAPMDVTYLLLGVANSSLMSRFHDLAFNNRLYSARRRYITQYVANYPYPSPASPAAAKLIATVKRAVEKSMTGRDAAEISQLENEVNSLTYEAFNLPPSEPAR